MAEPGLGTTQSYDPTQIDATYVERQRELAWQELLKEAEAGTGEMASAAPAPGPGTAPELPGRAPTGEKPSPLTVAVQEAGRAAGAAAKAAMQGMTKALVPGVTPGGQAEAEAAKAGTRGSVMQAVAEVGGGLVDKVAAVRQLMLEGLMGLGMAPFVGAGAGVRQALENAGIADVTAADPINASFLRMITSGKNPMDPTMSAEERQALWAPMTLGEFAEIATQAAPILAGGGRKVGEAVRMQAPEIIGQRGSVGPVTEALAAARARVQAARAAQDTAIARLTEQWNAGGTASGRHEPVPQGNIRVDPAYQSARAELSRAEQALSRAEKEDRAPTLKGQRGSIGPAPDLGALEAAARKATEAVDALGPEPPRPSGEAKHFGPAGRAGAPPESVARYDAEVKASSRWRRQFSKLKKAEVEASNAAFHARRAVSREMQAEAAQTHGVELNLTDPDSIAAFVRQHGGVKPDPALAGEFQRIPLDLKNKNGLRYDVLAEQGGVDGRALLDALTNMESLRRQKRERDAARIDAEVNAWAGYEAKTEDPALTMAIDEWDRMMAESERDVNAHAEAAGRRAADEGVGAPPSGPGPGEGASAAGASEAGGPVPGRGVPERPPAPPGGPPGAAPPGRGDAGGVSRLNTARINADERVKALMADLNQRVGGTTLAEHRQVVTHAQTTAEGASRTLDQLLLADPASTSIEEGRPIQQGLRNYYNTVATKLEELVRQGGDPETTADTLALALHLAGLDERFGAGFARGLEARKIQSEAVSPTPGPTPKRERTQVGGLSQQNIAWLGEQLRVDPAEIAAKVREQVAAQPEPSAPAVPVIHEATGLPVNDDGTVTLYHGTTAAGAAEIRRTGTLKSAGEPDVYLTTDPAGGGYGDRVVSVRVNPAKLLLEDEFPDGRRDFRLSTGKPAGTVKVAVEAPAMDAQAQARAGDALAATIAAARVGAGQPAQKPAKVSVAELVIQSMRAQLDQLEVTPETLVSMLQHLTKPQQRSFLANVWNGMKATRDIAHLAYLNALLSDPTTTHVANVGGTSLIVPWEMAVRQVAEIIHAVSSSDPAGVQLGETMAMARSLARANQTALHFMSERMRTGMTPFEQVNVANKGPITAERYGFDPQNGFGRFIGTAGAALESRAAPITWMGVEDAYFKGLNSHLEGAALALRKATAELPNGTAQEIQALALKYEATPTADMLPAMQKQAALRTLNNQLGPAGQYFSKWVDAFPLGRWILPFKRTPINAMVWWKQNTPLLNLMGKKLYTDVFQGTAAEREMALARLGVGWGVGLAIAAYVHSGNITGDGLTDDRLKKFRQFTDRPKNTIGGTGPGDARYTYDRFDPVFGIVGAIATFEELRANVPPEQSWLDWTGAHMVALAMAAGQVFASKANMQTVGNIIDSIKHPERWGEAYTRGFVRSLVPSFVRHLASAEDGNVVREVHGLMDAFQSGIPLWAEGLPPTRHPILSDPVLRPPGIVGEYLQASRVYPVTGDPVMAALADHGVAPTALPWYVAGRAGKSGPLLEEPTGLEGEKLTVKERDRWGELIGTQKLEVFDQERTLYDALYTLIKSTDYREDWPKNLRARQLDKIYKKYRQAALLTVEQESLGDPEGIVARLAATKIRQIQSLAPKSMQGQVQDSARELLQSLGR